MRKFATWDQRVDFLEELSTVVHEKFHSDAYNVFVFGSFLRDDYDPDKSDLDLAIYAKESELTFAIVDFLDQLDAYVVVKPLGLNVSFTNYYPEELKLYFRTVQRRAIFYNEEAEHIEKVREAMMYQ